MSEMEKKANRVDDLILQYIDSHSPEDISRMLNGVVSPARIRLRAQEMVSAVDWLTEAEQDKVVTLKLRRILAELEGRYMDIDNAKLRIGALKEIGNRLDKRKAATQQDLTLLYGNHARLMAEVVFMAVDRAIRALQQTHPEIEEAEVTDALDEAVPVALMAIEERNAGEAINP